MKRTNKQFDRRSFIKGAAVAGAAMVGANVVGACSPETSTAPPENTTPIANSATSNAAAAATSFPVAEKLWERFAAEGVDADIVDIAFVADQISESEIIGEEDYEFIVVGAGMAGAATAASAAESGNNVLVLEKTGAFQTRGHQIGCINSKLHKEAGVVLDPNEVVSDLLMTVGFRAKQSLWERWAKNCDEAVNWLLDLLDGYAGEPWIMFPNGNVQTATTRWWSTAIIFEIPDFPNVCGGLINHAVENGATVLYNTPAVQLVQDGDGRVVAVVARTEDGYKRFSAAKGVALCTGGYEFNTERVRKYMRPRDLALKEWPPATIGATGDGHEMGLAAGGIEDEYPHCIMNDPVIFMTWPRVNIRGERFVSEYSPFNYIANAIQHQPGACCFVIGDDNAQAAAERMWNETHVQGTPESWYETFKASDLQANTLEELAEKMEVPVEAFLATVERYNKLGDKGVDEDFNNPPQFLCPIKTPPFYAIKDYAAGLVTVSGLRISDYSEVLNGSTFNPIPGLYAIGNCSGDMYADTYPHNVNGVSHSRCITFGYLLGKRI
jgi:succinate dehydrogenase/fumarate reductase flavoprotein subunit